MKNKEGKNITDVDPLPGYSRIEFSYTKYGYIREFELYIKSEICYDSRIKCDNPYVFLHLCKFLLFDENVDIKTHCGYILNYFCVENHPEIVTLLLQHPDIDPRAINSLCLNSAACYNNVHIVNILLKDKRADPNAKNSQNLTALEIACVNNHFDVVKALLKDPRVVKCVDEKRVKSYGVDRTEILKLI